MSHGRRNLWRAAQGTVSDGYSLLWAGEERVYG